MRTVQDLLREADPEQLARDYVSKYPPEVLMLKDKTRTVGALLDACREGICGYIRYLRDLEPRPGKDTMVFFLAESLEDGFFEPAVHMCSREDILTKERPESYSLLLIDHAEIVSYLVAETPYTVRHMDDLLCEILHESSFFGYTQEEMDQEKADLDERVKEVDEAIQSGHKEDALKPFEEVCEELGWEPEKHDERLEEKRKDILRSIYELSQTAFAQQLALVRALLAG